MADPAVLGQNTQRLLVHTHTCALFIAHTIVYPKTRS
jgi:hypothetical protein